MEGQKRVNRAKVFKVGALLCMIVAAWYFLSIGDGFHAAFSFFQNVEAEEKILPITSTGYRYDKKFQDTLSHYRYFRSLYREEFSTAVPGLESTDVLGQGCDRMVPQGICIAGDYMLVTAYDNVKHISKKGKGGYPANPSILYVLSNEDPSERRLLTTIVLPDVNHVGGIAFDGENVWIAKSTDRECSMVSYQAIEEAVQEGAGSYALLAYGQNVDCGVVASFLAWHDGRLWIGTHINKRNGKGMLRGYQVAAGESGERKLILEEEIEIPGYANGVDFAEIGKKTYMVVTVSKGRYYNSWVYLYEVEKDGGTGKRRYDCYNARKFPPMAEEVACDGENAYFLFESSATCYSAVGYQRCGYLVDRICALSMMELFCQGQGYRNGKQMERGGILIVQDEKDQEKRYWWDL